jgi:tRNA(His) guanylyltransferase
MPESSLNEYMNWPAHEIFSKSCIPPETPFSIRLDGWRFKKVSEAINAEKPFDEKFAKCLVSSGKALFIKGFNPALIYVASDELNVLFLNTLPFHGRVEKTDSALACIVSSAFSLSRQKLFSRELVVAFDSRVVFVHNEDKIIDYLSWRQMNSWRNHNNAYAYWVLRRTGLKPSEIARKLKGLKAEELHELMFKQRVNVAETPRWQRRGILVYKQPYLRQNENHRVTRWRINENWGLPLFTGKDGAELIYKILEFSKQKKEK